MKNSMFGTFFDWWYHTHPGSVDRSRDWLNLSHPDDESVPLHVDDRDDPHIPTAFPSRVRQV